MSENGIKSFVTDLKPIEEQVGEHILTALTQPNTAAILTSIVPGLGKDRVASIPITHQQLRMIQQLLQQEQRLAITEERSIEEEERSIGFQIDVPSNSTED
jgi:4-hydroxy-3-methylbut-2-en-1-yl diphosphate synthase IspG/GcpE